MDKISDIFTTVIKFQCAAIFSALTISSLGGVFDQPHLAYFWYLALAFMAMMLFTSFIMGMVLILSRLLQKHSSRVTSKSRRYLFSRPKSVRI
jgi:hypothetical protein